MKMPRRPFFLPVSPRPDIFGLRRLTLAHGAESAADRQKRVATIEAGVVAAFKAAVGHLGEDEARQLFARVVRRPKRGPGKMLAPDRNYRLLIPPYRMGNLSRRSPGAFVPVTAASSWAIPPTRSRPKSVNW
jgi:hypothetical protein